jgi:hypothetical protein
MQIEEVKEHLIATVNAKYKILDKTTDTEVAFTVTGDTLYVDFEGSLSGTDWLYNFDMCFSYREDFKVHFGIYKKWNSVENTIFGIVRYYKKVVFRGFSQGGAMALIALYALRFMEKCSAVCFATPAIFRKGLLDNHNYSNRVDLYQISNDPVTWMFPGILGYRRYGKVHILDNFPWYRRIIPDFSVHNPAGYLKWL